MPMSSRDIDKLAKSIGETAVSLNNFAVAVSKVKKGSVADVNIELTRDDCVALIWGIQMLRQGQSDG